MNINLTHAENANFIVIDGLWYRMIGVTFGDSTLYYYDEETGDEHESTAEELKNSTIKFYSLELLT